MKKNTFALKGPKGVTLIELSVVIAVILVLISVLFIGATYYRDSANRSACVINQSAIAKGAESYMNIQGLTTVASTVIVGANANTDPTVGPFAGARPQCPNGGTYTFTTATGQISSKSNTNPDGVSCSVADHINN